MIVEQFLTYASIYQLGISLELEQGIYMNAGMADFYKADLHKKFSGYSSTAKRRNSNWVFLDKRIYSVRFRVDKEKF